MAVLVQRMLWKRVLQGPFPIPSLRYDQQLQRLVVAVTFIIAFMLFVQAGPWHKLGGDSYTWGMTRVGDCTFPENSTDTEDGTHLERDRYIKLVLGTFLESHKNELMLAILITYGPLT